MVVYTFYQRVLNSFPSFLVKHGLLHTPLPNLSINLPK